MIVLRILRGIGFGVKWTLLLFALVLVVGVVAVVVKAAQAHHESTKPVSVAGRVAGSFVRSGCIGCGDLAPKIATTDVYCGWHGNDVIVHVTMRNESAETATVHWHPSYSIANGAPHGTGLSSVQDSKLKAGQAESVYIRQSPAGVTAGTRLARCYPSFFNVTSG